MWQAVKAVLDSAASDRADAMKSIVDLGGQTVAAPLLNLDQSTISRTLGRPRELRRIPLPPEVLDLIMQGAREHQVRDLTFGDAGALALPVRTGWLKALEARGRNDQPKTEKKVKKGKNGKGGGK
ncbi:hypothetical protein [Kitasatospora brasiliensis]|uniref:hypothetical protein n=1 Tax=Kitasatospora brasiliensis TaxID=3058040 RepID=UPI00292DAC5D|nr:hypothetical protein [Kitasatospora sp. K002]